MADQKMRPAGGDTKQKITIAVIVVVVLIVIWQVVGILGGSSKQAAVAPAAKPMSATSPNSASPQSGSPNMAMNPMMSPNNMPVPAAPQAPQNSQSSAPAVQVNPALLKLQQETEAKYIEAVNELQILKIRREIAETKQAISKSTLDTMTSEHKMSDLLVKPPAPGREDYANSLGGPNAGPNGMMVATTTTTTTTEPAYVLLSVSKQSQRWSAVLGNAGKLYSVTIGDTIPTDGSVVVSIDTDGVVLEKDGKKRRIAISSTI